MKVIKTLLIGVWLMGSLALHAQKANIFGTVTADGKPLAGVPVSDGYEVTTTGADGRYELNSHKRHGYVFISIPGGYEVPVEGVVPKFWTSLNKPVTQAEQHDFKLSRVDNVNHVVLAITDLHLAGVYNDKEQLCMSFMPSINNTVKQLAGQKVYTLSLGDLSFERYWYLKGYDIADYRKTMEVVKYPTPMFSVIGNHDHDGGTAFSDSTDFMSAAKYKKALGPTYYSFNLGKVHYVVLDNIIYLNESNGKVVDGLVGKRNYITRVSEEQRDWLKKDLALVKDKNTPVVVAMHAATYRYEGISPEVVSWLSKPEYSEEITDCFRDFKEVHYLSGHTHRNNTVRYKNVVEHNIGAVCGSWWRTGSNLLQALGPDGGPAGYAVFNVQGSNLSWYYNSIEDGAQKQFRVFDMNEVRRYYRDSKEVATFLSHYPQRVDFRQLPDNLVYIHVWGWEPKWKVEVTENGQPLTVTRELTEDPLYTITNDIPATVWINKFPASMMEEYLKNHIFVVKASKPDSKISVTVTDAFGKVYTETVARPKAFSTAMK